MKQNAKICLFIVMTRDMISQYYTRLVLVNMDHRSDIEIAIIIQYLGHMGKVRGVCRGFFWRTNWSVFITDNDLSENPCSLGVSFHLQYKVKALYEPSRCISSLCCSFVSVNIAISNLIGFLSSTMMIWHCVYQYLARCAASSQVCLQYVVQFYFFRNCAMH